MDGWENILHNDNNFSMKKDYQKEISPLQILHQYCMCLCGLLDLTGNDFVISVIAK